MTSIQTQKDQLKTKIALLDSELQQKPSGQQHEWLARREMVSEIGRIRLDLAKLDARS